MYRVAVVTVWVLVIAITVREFIPLHATFLAFPAVIPIMAILVTPIPIAIPPVAIIPVDIRGSLVTVDDLTRVESPLAVGDQNGNTPFSLTLTLNSIGEDGSVTHYRRVLTGGLVPHSKQTRDPA